MSFFKRRKVAFVITIAMTVFSIFYMIGLGVEGEAESIEEDYGYYPVAAVDAVDTVVDGNENLIGCWGLESTTCPILSQQIEDGISFEYHFSADGTGTWYISVGSRITEEIHFTWYTSGRSFAFSHLPGTFTYQLSGSDLIFTGTNTYTFSILQYCSAN